MTSSHGVSFRLAEPPDYPEIARITRESYLEAGYFPSAEHPYMRKIQDVAQRAQQAEVWVAEQQLAHGAALVGSVTLARHGEHYAEIARAGELEVRMLVVDPRRQGAGIGTGMIRAIIDQARIREGIRAISLTTGDAWEAAHALYRSLGFQRQPERDWTIVRDDSGAVPDAPAGHQKIWLRVYRLEI